MFIYINAMALAFIIHLILNGIGLRNFDACHTSVYVSIIMYFIPKFCMYLFLLERVHAAGGSNCSRLRDWVRLTGMAILNTGGLTMIICCIVVLRYGLSGGHA